MILTIFVVLIMLVILSLPLLDHIEDFEDLMDFVILLTIAILVVTLTLSFTKEICKTVPDEDKKFELINRAELVYFDGNFYYKDQYSDSEYGLEIIDMSDCYIVCSKERPHIEHYSTVGFNRLYHYIFAMPMGDITTVVYLPESLMHQI